MPRQKKLTLLLSVAAIIVGLVVYVGAYLSAVDQFFILGPSGPAHPVYVNAPFPFWTEDDVRQNRFRQIVFATAHWIDRRVRPQFWDHAPLLMLD